MTPPRMPSSRLLRTIPIAVALIAVVLSASWALPALASPSHAAPSAKPAHAAPSAFAGHWEADVQGDGRVFTFVFDLTIKGDSLGGKLSILNREGEVPITGFVKGNHIHFEQFGLWDGTLAGSGLKLTRGLDGGKVQHMTAHRATRS